MIVRDKYGNERNLGYKYAVEWCPYEPDRDDGFRQWFVRGKYKTQRAMLQALRQFKENEKNGSKCRVSHDGGKTWFDTHWLYRPVHLNYDL